MKRKVPISLRRTESRFPNRRVSMFTAALLLMKLSFLFYYVLGLVLAITTIAWPGFCDLRLVLHLSGHEVESHVLGLKSKSPFMCLKIQTESIFDEYALSMGSMKFSLLLAILVVTYRSKCFDPLVLFFNRCFTPIASIQRFLLLWLMFLGFSFGYVEPPLIDVLSLRSSSVVLWRWGFFIPKISNEVGALFFFDETSPVSRNRSTMSKGFVSENAANPGFVMAFIVAPLVVMGTSNQPILFKILASTFSGIFMAFIAMDLCLVQALMACNFWVSQSRFSHSRLFGVVGTQNHIIYIVMGTLSCKYFSKRKANFGKDFIFPKKISSSDAFDRIRMIPEKSFKLFEVSSPPYLVQVISPDFRFFSIRPGYLVVSLGFSSDFLLRIRSLFSSVGLFVWP